MPKIPISQIYQTYRLMPNLQTHQLRVAAISQRIAEALVATGQEVDVDAITSACLLHDMGNILKFDLNLFPEFSKPKGVAYWQSVKDDFQTLYGDNEHQATQAIYQELGVRPAVAQLINQMSFLKTTQHFSDDQLAWKICEYADMRVGPFGIISLAERMTDLRQRYGHRYPEPEHQAAREAFEAALTSIEQQLFAQIDLQPSDLTDSTLHDKIDSLKSYPVTAEQLPEPKWRNW